MACKVQDSISLMGLLRVTRECCKVRAGTGTTRVSTSHSLYILVPDFLITNGCQLYECL